MPNKQETKKRIKLKYPEIREILRKLYKSAYLAGSGDGDGYDHSTSYEEIEQSLDQYGEQLLSDYKKEQEREWIENEKRWCDRIMQIKAEVLSEYKKELAEKIKNEEIKYIGGVNFASRGINDSFSAFYYGTEIGVEMTKEDIIKLLND